MHRYHVGQPSYPSDEMSDYKTVRIADMCILISMATKSFHMRENVTDDTNVLTHVFTSMLGTCAGLKYRITALLISPVVANGRISGTFSKYSSN
jgi:hypothetical protein